MADPDSGMEMSLLEHLGELRHRLVKCVLVTIVAFFVCYGFHIELFNLVSAPIQEGLVRHGIYQFRAIQVTEPMMVYLKTSFVCALVIGSPYLIAQTWFFVAPGLLSSERRLALPIIFFTTGFFLLGVAFCYRIVLPVITDFLVGVGEETVTVAVDVTLDSALSYALTFLVVFGAIFELPMVLYFITLLGIVTPKQLVDFGRYWVVLAFIIGAMVTPPDPVSQLMMAFPLVILYGVGTATSFVAYRYVSDEHEAPVQAEEFVGPSQFFSNLGAGLLGLVLLGFIWLLLPRYDHDALFFVDSESPVLMGMQPHVLHGNEKWGLVAQTISQDFPELQEILTNPAAFPDTVIYEGDVEGRPLLVLTGQDLRTKLSPYVPAGCEARGEGDFLLHGTRPALRGSSGQLWACLEHICLVGPSVRVLEKVRSSTAGLLLSDDVEELYALKESGPFWGVLNRSMLRRLAKQQPGLIPKSTGKATFSFGGGSDGIDSLILSLMPAPGGELEALRVETAALPGLESEGRGVSESLFRVQGGQALRELVLLQMRAKKQAAQGETGAFVLKAPELNELLEENEALPTGASMPGGRWSRALAPFMSVVEGGPEVQIEGGAVRAVWATSRSQLRTRVAVP